MWTGRLPFKDIDKENIDLALETSKKDKSRDVKEICKGYPEVVQDLLSYVRSLEFDETPDYVMMRGLVESEFDDFGFKEDGYFDWFYSADGDEVVNTIGNLDQVYDKIFTLVHGDYSSLENTDSSVLQAGKPKKGNQPGSEKAQTRNEKIFSHNDPAKNVNENRPARYPRSMVSSRTGSLLRRVKSIRNSYVEAASTKSVSRKKMDCDNGFTNAREQKTMEKKNLLRGLGKKLLRTNK